MYAGVRLQRQGVHDCGETGGQTGSHDRRLLVGPPFWDQLMWEVPQQDPLRDGASASETSMPDIVRVAESRCSVTQATFRS